MAESVVSKIQDADVLTKGVMLDELWERHSGDFASKAAMGRVVQGIFTMMSEQLEAGGSVRIQDFGTLEVKSYGPRKGRNPSTKEDIEIPAQNRVKFHAAARLKEAVN